MPVFAGLNNVRFQNPKYQIDGANSYDFPVGETFGKNV
jgi:hypothetical protein